jgi:hypothetical protein
MTHTLASTKWAVKDFFGFFGGGSFVAGAVPEPPPQDWRLSIEDCRLKIWTNENRQSF